MRVYPPGAATRRACDLLKGRIEPLIIYETHDGNIQWCLNGGLDPMAGVQEGAFLEDGVSGLHPSFQHIDHKSARQPGVTNQRTVYDPAEYDMQVEFTVPPNHVQPELAAQAIRRVIRHWMESWDPEKPGLLKWVTPDMGVWKCNPRLFRSPPDRQFKMQARRLRQKYTWVIRNDGAFWRGPRSVSMFRIKQQRMIDTFTRDDAETLGPQWQQTYTGAGAGVCETHNGYAGWTPSGALTRTVRNRLLGVNEIQTVSIVGSFTGGTWTYTVNGQTTTGIAYNASAATVQSAIEALSNVAPGDVSVSGLNGGPWTVTFIGALAFTNVVSAASGAGLTPGGTAASAQVATKVDGSGPNTTSDNQVVTVKLGELYQYPFPPGGAITIQGRWNGNDASPTMVQAKIEDDTVTLSRFNAGVETVMFSQGLNIPPMFWEEWSLVCGIGASSRHFKVLRNGFPAQDQNGNLFYYKETGTGSAVGASNRGSGWGMTVGAGATQQIPPTIDEFSVGENPVATTQSGNLSLTNFGDQDGYPEILFYGPGSLKVANGPDSATMIEFGPLVDNQVALLKTLPRERGVVDLTPYAAEQPVELEPWKDFLARLLSFAVSGDTPPLFEWFESLLGIKPPQGELYHLLQGRFTKPLPPKPSGVPPATYSLACQIIGGNADSKVVAALTPRRRWPE